MPALDASFPEIVEALSGHYGPPAFVDEGDFPFLVVGYEAAPHAPAAPFVGGGDFPFLVVAAAILAGTLDPLRLRAAESALGSAGLLDARALAKADPVEIREALKEGGISLPSRGVGPLVRLARWLVERHHGSADWLREAYSVPTAELREDLRGLNGVGPATADALLLHGLNRATYPLDRATYRVLVRHDWLEPTADYDEARDLIERRLPDDPPGLARLAAWMERIGRDFCRAGAPKCERCPLRPFLPPGGPVSPEVE